MWSVSILLLKRLLSTDNFAINFKLFSIKVPTANIFSFFAKIRFKINQTVLNFSSRMLVLIFNRISKMCVVQNVLN